MLVTSHAELTHLSAHHIGNKTNGDDLAVSKEELEVTDDVRLQLQKFFLGSFVSEEVFRFSSTDGDFRKNPLFQMVTDMFESSKVFHLRTIQVARHLYEVSTHPQIKAGDLYVAYFTNVKIDDEETDAIGIFKAESQHSFLQLHRKRDGNFSLDCQSGISMDKLDKGCLIFRTQAGDGFRLSIIDRTGKSHDAQYWKELFLRAEPVHNHFQSTKNVLDIAREFVTDQMGEEFDVSRADQAGYLKKSIDYFKTRDEFNRHEFEKEVFEDPDLIKSYKKFDRDYRSRFNFDDEQVFDISREVVRKQSRVFKSVLKLDKNFHIYIHGDRSLIERGTEKDGRKFYKIYYREEF